MLLRVGVRRSTRHKEIDGFASKSTAYKRYSLYKDVSMAYDVAWHAAGSTHLMLF